MRLVDVLGALGRRWILTLLCLILTAGLGLGASRLVAQRYTATAHVLFLPPTTSVAPDQNPYMQLGGLYQAVEMVGVALSDQATMEEIKGISSKAEVVVRQDPLSSAPLLLITVVDSDEARTLRILDVMLTKVPSRLDQLQASIYIRVTNRVTSMVLTKDTEAKPTGLDQIRAIIVAIAAGLLFTTMFVAFLDGVFSRRRTRRLRLEDSGQTKGAPNRRSRTSAPKDDRGPKPGAREPRRERAPMRKMRIGSGGRGRRMRPYEPR
jgi:TRAP-type C4-dicarboxylate transport system permease small subunit